MDSYSRAPRSNEDASTQANYIGRTSDGPATGNRAKLLPGNASGAASEHSHTDCVNTAIANPKNYTVNFDTSNTL